jgi:hypothetical protein
VDNEEERTVFFEEVKNGLVNGDIMRREQGEVTLAESGI